MKRSEIWVDVVGYESFYLVSNYGRVKSLKSEKILKPNVINGYHHVTLYKDSARKLKRIHRLVIGSFTGQSKQEVNHINGNKSDNNLLNLEYSNRSMNMKHAFKNGLHNLKGHNHNNSKFTLEQVKDIKIRLRNGERNKDIAELYGVCPTLISHIKRGYTYEA